MKTAEKTIGSNEWTGRVYSDVGEQHHDNVEEYLNWLACEGYSGIDVDLWTVAECHPKAPSAVRLVCDTLEGEGYDGDLIDTLLSRQGSRMVEFQVYLTEWFANDAVMAYFPTRTRVVLSDEHRAMFAALVAEFA